jgi:hypothetical protein
MGRKGLEESDKQAFHPEGSGRQSLLVRNQRLLPALEVLAGCSLASFHLELLFRGGQE